MRGGRGCLRQVDALAATEAALRGQWELLKSGSETMRTAVDSLAEDVSTMDSLHVRSRGETRGSPSEHAVPDIGARASLAARHVGQRKTVRWMRNRTRQCRETRVARGQD